MTETSRATSDPVESARDAGLVYVNRDGPGITRKRRGKSFEYFDADGKRITDPDELFRIRSLVVPPAWTYVWICPNWRGHIQAVGTDARGRTQYRYHPKWREVRDESKYERMIEFAKVLPKIRARVRRDLRKPGLSREKVLATVVKLLETTLIRVGNGEYAKNNKSYGLTTIRNKHVEVHGSKIHFEFRGKSGVEHAIDIDDPRLAKVVRACQDLPEQELFEYIDEADGSRHDITSSDVNAYLKQIDPKHPGYINLLPTWARQIKVEGSKYSYLGTATYEDYVRQFVQKVKPAMLCYDNYGMLKHGDRGDFHENLETVRKVAQEANIPFWNIVLVTQHGDFRVLTEPELRFEAMQTLAFGARGLVWFTYWSPQGIDTGTTWTHAMIDEHGSRTEHYEMVRSINADVLAIGRELKNAKNVGLVQREKGKSVSTGETPLKLDGGDVSVGVFATPDGKRMALVANRDYKAATKSTFSIDAREKKVERFDVERHAWRAASDYDSVALQLPPGAAALLRW